MARTAAVLLAALLLPRTLAAGLEFQQTGPVDARVAMLSMKSYFGGPFGSWIPYGGFVDRDGRLYDLHGSSYPPVGCPVVRALEAVGIGTFVVATDCGPRLVSIYNAGPLPIPGLPPGAVITVLGDGLAGTAGQGVYRRTADASPGGAPPGTFVPDADGLPPGASIVAIGHAREHSFVSLATGGVFEKGSDDTWRDVSEGLPDGALVTAIGGAQEPWLAMESGGLWRRTSNEVWVRDESIPSDLRVWALTGADGKVIAAAGPDGLLRLTPAGWQAETPGVPSADVRSLAVVKAGSTFGGELEAVYVGTQAQGVRSAVATPMVRTLPAIVDTAGATGERWRTAVTVVGGGVIGLIQGGPPRSSAQIGAPYQPSGGLYTTDIAAWLADQGTPMPQGRAAESLSSSFGYPYFAPAKDVRLIARVYSSLARGGTRGVALEDTSDVDGAEEEASVYGLRSTEGVERANLAVVALPYTSGQERPVTLSVQVFGSDGTAAPRVLEKTLVPGEWAQWNDVLQVAGLPDGASGYARITRTGGTGVWTAYGVVNDAATSDGSVLPLYRPGGPSATRHLLVPVVLDVRGAAGSHYATELTLVNDAIAPATASLTFQAGPGFGGPRVAESVNVALAAGEQRTIPDVVALLRAAGVDVPSSGSGDVAGTLHVTFPGFDRRTARTVGALARTTTPNTDQRVGGRFGVSYPAVAWGQGARDRASVLGVSSPEQSRWNFAVVNLGGGSGGALTLSLPRDPAAPLEVPPPRVTLTAGEWYQANGIGPVGVVKRLSGDDTFLVYGVMNDAVTSDGTILPMYFVDR